MLFALGFVSCFHDWWPEWYFRMLYAGGYFIHDTYYIVAHIPSVAGIIFGVFPDLLLVSRCLAA